MKNIIYYFTGTGNSLKVAREIAVNLPDCQVVSISARTPVIPDGDVERIGFVYPCYGGGLPLMVKKFVAEFNFSRYPNAYLFAVATYGGFALNAVTSLNKLLRDKGTGLSYGAALHMPGNYIVMYGRREKSEELLQNMQDVIMEVSIDISARKKKHIGRPNPLFNRFYQGFAAGIPGTAQHYNVRGCRGCGLCARLCPAGNITMENDRPVFSAHCEACMACIQHCPCRAINYKNDTQSRERYVHPEISAKEIAKGNE